MYNKIIIVVPREFSEKEYIKNSIKDIIQKKIKIEIWIIKKLLNPKSQIDKKLLYLDKDINFKIIDNSRELNSCLINEKSTTLFDLRLRLDFKNIYFFYDFFNYNFDFITHAGLVLRKFNLKYIIYLKLKNFLIYLIFLIKGKTLQYSKYVYLIGEKADLISSLLINSKSILIKGHHADYDRFLESKKKMLPLQKNYFVFIDQNVPFHQDLVEMDKNDVNEKNYYTSIKDFLEKTKKKYNLDYYISPHPRSNISQLKNYFGSQISKENTLETIKNCKFVICHDSTATNFAFLFDKPIISIYDKELASSKYNHLKEIKRFCRRTNASLLNIHEDQIKATDLIISETEYKNFIKKYIKCHNEDKKRADILKDKINFYE